MDSTSAIPPQGTLRPSLRPAWVVGAAAVAVAVCPAVPSLLIPAYEHPSLLLLFNLMFITVISAWLTRLTLEGYRLSGRREMLSAGCGFLIFGAGALVAGVAFAAARANAAAAVYNLAALAAAACHLDAATSSFRMSPVAAAPRRTRAATAYIGALVFLGAISSAALAGLLPEFVSTMDGGTGFRAVVLSGAIGLLVAAATALLLRARSRSSALLQWYAVGLLLMSVGILAALVSPQGSPTRWIGRAAKYAGHLFFLAGFLSAMRTARRKGLDLRQALTEFNLQSDEHLQALIANSPEAVISVDPEQRVYLWNPAAEALFGRRAAEVVGRPIGELLQPEPAAAGVLQEALAQRSTRGVQLEVRRSDGSPLAVELTAFASGESTSLILRDVTERLRAERSLREGKEKLRLALAGARAGMWEWDISSGGLTWSPEQYDLYGIAPGTEVRVTHWEARVHPDDLSRVWEHCRRHVDGLAPDYRCEFRIRHPERGERWVLDVGRVQRDAEGRPLVMAGLNMDVTDRKAAEQALRESERLYRAIGESIDYGIWVADPQGSNTYASDSFLKLLGMTPDRFRGNGWSEALHPQDAERSLAAWAECLRTEGRLDIEHRFRGADGTYHPILSRGMPVRDDAGRITCWAGISLDIGRLKRTEMRLEAARAEATREKNRLEAVMETLPVGVAIVNARGGLLRSNSAYEAVWGRPRPDVRSTADYDAFKAWWHETGEPVRPDEWAAARALSTGRPVVGQVMRIGRFDGSTAFVLNSASPILSPDGKALGAAVAVLDISERIQAERRLRAGEEELRRLNADLEQRVRERTLALEDTVARLQAEIAERRRAQNQLQQLSRVFMDAADPIIIEDLSGTVIDMNREAERAYGYTRAELVGRPVRTLFLPERYALAEALRERCRRGEEVRAWEARRRGRDGTVHSLLLTAFPLMDDERRIVSIATIAKDIGPRLQMEEELKRSHRRLQELSVRSLEALEADRQAVSRELHDGIGGSLAAIGYALEDVEAKIACDPGAAVIALRRTLGHLRDTIKESKRISVNLRPLTLDDLGLLSTIDWYTGQFAQNFPHIHVNRNVELTEGEVPEPLKIVIYRVLQEALTNAARHSGAGEIGIRLEEHSGVFTLEVSDNGCGFDPAALTRPGDGLSGMGLKSMQERAAICGGTLTVESKPGEGTRVRVALPAAVGGVNGQLII